MNAEFLEAYLANELDDNARRQVEEALSRDAELRDCFLQQVQVDLALRYLMPEDGEESTDSFEEAILARLKSEGAGESHGFAKSVLTEIVNEREEISPVRWPDLLRAGVISAAASIALMFVLQEIIFSQHPFGLKVAQTGLVGPEFVARVEVSEGLEWSKETGGAIREDGWLSNGLIEIESGEATIAFNSGATATVEGPAALSIESSNRVFLNRGKLTADVPPPASGFTVNTPRMNAVDIGTRFGIEVDVEGNSELHVMEGEVEASRSSGNSVTVLVREGLALRADERTRSELSPIPYAGDEFVLQIGALNAPAPALQYSFDESVGAVVEDSGASRQFDIPLVSKGGLDKSPRRTAGIIGSGLVFQPGSMLDVSLPGEFRMEKRHTVSFWLKIPPKLGSRDGLEILEYGRDGTGWRVSCENGSSRGMKGALKVEFDSGLVVGSTDLADGNWHHVAYRFIGGETANVATHVHLFIDGRPETISDFQPGEIGRGRVGSLRLGGSETRGLEGWIDELNLFDEAIPTPMIQSLYQR
ncbi:MAG: FecR domain-containing protein [Verrucomicrobiales bacterium]|nr:FecR domain-containing protein [Verrucomicrobiales bacterium]